MTQILTCLTQAFAVQVADRRLTDLNTGELYDDDATKAVLFGSEMLFAYTGLARMRAGDRAETHWWLADALFDETRLTKAVEMVRSQAGETIGKLANLGPRAKRHAFVGAGFPQRSDGRRRPCYVTISNALRKDGGWEERSSPDFATDFKWLRATTELELFDAGVRMKHEQRKQLRARLRAALRGSQPGREVMDLLLAAVSQCPDQRVGDGMNASYLPASATGRQPWRFVEDAQRWEPASFDPAEPLCIYVNPTDGDRLNYAPMWVHGQLAFQAFTTDRVLSPEEIKAMWDTQKRRYGRDDETKPSV